MYQHCPKFLKQRFHSYVIQENVRTKISYTTKAIVWYCIMGAKNGMYAAYSYSIFDRGVSFESFRSRLFEERE